MFEGSRKTYEANCHCGNIRYTVTLPDALYPEGKGVIGRCNCSICTKNGYHLVYPKREDVVFLGDSESKLKDYFFGKKNKPHRFCPECSSSVMIDFKNSDIVAQRAHLAMNVSRQHISNCPRLVCRLDRHQARLFKDIDLLNAKYSDFDGMKKLDPPYQG